MKSRNSLCSTELDQSKSNIDDSNRHKLCSNTSMYSGGYSSGNSQENGDLEPYPEKDSPFSLQEGSLVSRIKIVY